MPFDGDRWVGPHERGLEKQPAPGHDTVKPIPEHLDNWEKTYLGAYARSLAESNDPAFRAGMAEARHILVDMIRHELLRRAFEPYGTPVFSRGREVGTKWEYDNQLLLKLAERIAPEEFRPTKTVEVRGGPPIAFRFLAGEDPGEIEDGEIRELPTGPQEP